MTRPILAWATGALVCVHAFQSHAADLKDFPAGTQWVLNLDLKAAQASPLLNEVVARIAPAKRQEAQNKLAAIKALFGVDLLKDIGQLVIAGNGNADKGGVAYVYGTFDTQRLSTILAGGKNFTSFQHNRFTVLGWDDRQRKYLSFAAPSLALLSNSQAALTDALDVIAGSKAGLAPGSAMAAALERSGQDLLTVRAVNVSSIVGAQPKAQALKQARSLDLRVRASDPETLSASLSVTAASGETARQIQQALLGIQAITLLRSAESPESATLASLARVTCQGETVGVTMSLPKTVLETALRQREARMAAKAAAATNAPAAAQTPN